MAGFFGGATGLASLYAGEMLQSPIKVVALSSTPSTMDVTPNQLGQPQQAGGSALTGLAASAAGSFFDSLGLVRSTSAAVANSAAGWLCTYTARSFFQSGTAGVQPFTMGFAFRLPTLIAGQRFFCGYYPFNTSPISANVDPSQGSNGVGLAMDAADATLQIMQGPAGPLQKTNTGITRAAITNVGLICTISSNIGQVTISLQNIDQGGGILLATTIGAPLPIAANAMSPVLSANTAAAGGTCIIDLYKFVQTLGF